MGIVSINHHISFLHVCVRAPHLLPNYANVAQFQSVCVLSLLLWAVGFSTIPSEGGEALYKYQKSNARLTSLHVAGGNTDRQAHTDTQPSSREREGV